MHTFLSFLFKIRPISYSTVPVNLMSSVKYHCSEAEQHACKKMHSNRKNKNKKAFQLSNLLKLLKKLKN